MELLKGDEESQSLFAVITRKTATYLFLEAGNKIHNCFFFLIAFFVNWHLAGDFKIADFISSSFLMAHLNDVGNIVILLHELWILVSAHLAGPSTVPYDYLFQLYGLFGKFGKNTDSIHIKLLL